MPLTDMQIKQTEAQNKDTWLSDEKGLRLLVKTSGVKYWRMKYRFANKQKTLALGKYPDVSLKQARLERDKARMKIAEGIDPMQERQQVKLGFIMNKANTFSVLAKRWWEHQKGTWSKDHANRVWVRLEQNALPLLDKKPFNKIEPQDILLVTHQIEQRDALDVAGRVLQDIRRIFAYGIKMGHLKYNPAVDLTGVIKPRKTQHRASMQNSELGRFLLELDHYVEKGRILTQLATKTLLYTFVRSGELRGARWEELDLENALWRIPAERMKMKTEHVVPLSSQVVESFQQVQSISGDYDLIFPSERHRNQPMSDNTMRRAMMRLGYDGHTRGKSKATPHGFRANASSILNERGFNPDAIERQLSHIERNGVRAAYTHHARYLDERKIMMQWWADYLDEQKHIAEHLERTA